MSFINKSPAHIMEETFEYHHKKFDQNKRLRKDSSGSSSRDYECIKVEIERINDESPQITTNVVYPSSTTHNFDWSPQACSNKRSLSSNTSENMYPETLLHPEAKRPRTSSFSDSSSYESSNYSPLPFTQPNLATFPTPALALPPATTVLPKISDDTLRSICKYHGNMVRKFPKKERSPKDQERRDKNTIACRMSRRVKKLEHIAIEEQYKEFSQQTFDIIEQSMRATAYLHELMKLAATAPVGEREEHKTNMLMEQQSASITSQQKKPFTIAYLTGSEE